MKLLLFKPVLGSCSSLSRNIAIVDQCKRKELLLKSTSVAIAEDLDAFRAYLKARVNWRRECFSRCGQRHDFGVKCGLQVREQQKNEKARRYCTVPRLVDDWRSVTAQQRAYGAYGRTQHAGRFPSEVGTVVMWAEKQSSTGGGNIFARPQEAAYVNAMHVE